MDGVRTDALTTADRTWYRNTQTETTRLSVPRLFNSRDPHSRLYVANFDGTGNDAVADPEHMTNVARLHKQLLVLGEREPRVVSGYVEGPGTQSNDIASAWDGATGGSYDARLEAMYKQFIKQAKLWKQEDPHADIRLITTGFSRGAEQAAGFARMVHERGVHDFDGRRVVDRTFGADKIKWTRPPLIPPGRTLISEALYDPVGTGRPHDRDRRPPPSVVSIMQIVARDERRNAFPSSQIVPQGHSTDGRFLGVTVPGAHSDIGGSYHLNGLSTLNFNLMADFLNAHSDITLSAKQPEPTDPHLYVIHHSEDHLTIYRTSEYDRDGYRDVMGAEISPPHCRLVETCAPPERFDESLAPMVGQRHAVSIGPVPDARAIVPDAPSMPARDPVSVLPPPPAVPSRLSEPRHPDHAFFLQVWGKVADLDKSLDRLPDHYTDAIASALTVQARADGLERIDRVALSEDGCKLWAEQAPPKGTYHLFSKVTKVSTNEANTPMEQSGAQWPQAMEQFQQLEEQAAQRNQEVLAQTVQRSQQRGMSM